MRIFFCSICSNPEVRTKQGECFPFLCSDDLTESQNELDERDLKDHQPMINYIPALSAAS